MSDHDALLAAVLANPADDLPRLVFADWLEESGHPARAARARYIRIHIEASRLPHGSPERMAKTRQAVELRAQFLDEADPLIPDRVKQGGAVLLRDRGFLDEIRGDWADVAKLGKAGVFAAAPIRRVVVNGYDTFETFPKAAFFGRLAELRLHRIQSATVLPLVALNPSLVELRVLDVSSNHLSDGHLVAFFNKLPQAAFAGKLRVLDLSRTLLTDAGANALAATGGLDGLEELRLSKCDVKQGAKALLRQRFGDRVSF